MTETQNKEILQWHPAFYAGIQIEFLEESENLIFENEHQLGTKPLEIDVLIIKKQNEIPIQKNIGRIFRKHNIVEYKSPTDYLSIDDFYKVCGYACFYKADTPIVNSIRIEELTISLVCFRYPQKLLHHLTKDMNCTVRKAEKGIYYVEGAPIPIQIIVTRKLSEAENLWLKSLTNHLQKTETVKQLFQEYNKHKGNVLYESVLSMIIGANPGKFQEVRNMFDALRDLMKDELDAAQERGTKAGIQASTEICCELGLSRDETREKVRMKFSLSEDEAKNYIDQFWKS